ncbi:hypothetical protein ACTI_63720 [Actinoplanes sp. OR16]|uniref:hypothetical protein n=1 Tax=Actinoplanes sp. OR16 TaxID=946334 RepID=UPI000F70268C|nr:hypothetical protein [Actinoplanes sp. OR16]BBH69687.1 hypothetical protein ACTI_63720 [Actinoplanes sp. OR16]
MHIDILDLLDDTLSRLLTVRGELAAARRVEPGERQTAVIEAIEVAREFSASAALLLENAQDRSRVEAAARNAL